MITFFTIVRDGMPFISTHINVFNRLKCDWIWVVVEGTSRAIHDTSWCQEMPGRLSIDGTTEYLEALAKHHPRVIHLKQSSWEGKVAMCNAALAYAKPGLLWQIDSDELWTSNQIETMYLAFKHNPQKMWGMFYCRYFLGQNIVIVSENTYGNHDGEWVRVWRIREGMEGLTWMKHEPPVLSSYEYAWNNAFSREETRTMGLVFDHQSYSTEAQVAFKENFYGYSGALAQWRKLQANTSWPARVGDYLKWVKDDAMCDTLFKG